MASSSKSGGRRSLVGLGVVLALALATIGVLTFNTRPTVVEIRLTVDHVAFELLPPALAGQEMEAAAAPSPLATFEPLSDSLATPALKIRQADRVEAAAGGEALLLRPLAGGSVDLKSAGEPLQPRLALRGPAVVELQATPRPGGGARVVLDLSPAAPAAPAARATPGGASGLRAPALRLAVTHAGFALDLDRVETAGSPGAPDSARYDVPPDAPQLVAESAAGHPLQLGMTVAPGPGPGATMRVLDPATGEVTAPRRVEMSLAEPRFVSWGDRIVALQPAGGSPVTPLLRPGLPVAGLELWRLPKGEPVSFVLGGSIRFPLGEKANVDIEPGFYLSVAADRPLTLRALGVAGGKLELVLWGRPQSVRLGPAPELQTELLPNLFVWLYSHRLGGLIYSTLVAVTTVFLGLFRLLGAFKQ